MKKPNYKKLEEILKDKQEIAIFTHSNPDPDAIGSALGIQLLLEEKFNIKSEIFYSGQINHPENRSLINLAKIELNLVDSFDKKKYQDNLILVDTAVNSATETPLAVIDHHKLEKNNIKSQFKYIRPVGACVTLVWNLLSHYKIELDKQKHKPLITAMVHGLRADTGKFTSNVTSEDLVAYNALHELVDYELLRKIEHPPKTPAILDALANAIKNREIEGSYLLAGTGVIEESDAIPRAADYLLDLSGIETTIVYGIVDNNIRASIRTENATVIASELAQAIFGETAGGKPNAAGALIPIPFLDSLSLKDDLYTLVNKTVSEKFYKAIKTKKNGK